MKPSGTSSAGTPEGVNWVLENTSFPVLVLPLDVTNQAKLAPEFKSALAEQAGESDYSELVDQAYGLSPRTSPSMPCGTPPAAVYVTRPDLFEEPRPMRLSVVVDGYSQGAIREDDDGRDADVVFNLADKPAFYEYVLSQFHLHFDEVETQATTVDCPWVEPAPAVPMKQIPAAGQERRWRVGYARSLTGLGFVLLLGVPVVGCESPSQDVGGAALPSSFDLRDPTGPRSSPPWVGSLPSDLTALRMWATVWAAAGPLGAAPRSRAACSMQGIVDRPARRRGRPLRVASCVLERLQLPGPRVPRRPDARYRPSRALGKLHDRSSRSSRAGAARRTTPSTTSRAARARSSSADAPFPLAEMARAGDASRLRLTELDVAYRLKDAHIYPLRRPRRCREVPRGGEAGADDPRRDPVVRLLRRRELSRAERRGLLRL